MAVWDNGSLCWQSASTLYGCGSAPQERGEDDTEAGAGNGFHANATRIRIVARSLWRSETAFPPGFGVDPGQSYPDFLQSMLDGKDYKYRIVNAGISGDTSTDGLARVQDVLNLHPEIVILEFGGNDGLRGIPVSNIKTNLEQMLVSSTTLRSKCCWRQ